MPRSQNHRSILLAAILAPLIGALVIKAPTVQAASSIQTLVAQAEHNTNTVRTLVHNDTSSQTEGSITVKFTGHGAEDEVKNREKDYEAVTVSGKTQSGQPVNLHYTADIIFMNGFTYYRLSLQKNQWKTQKGMTFKDPYTGGWKRARTTVSFPKNLIFKQVGVEGGKTHVRATFTGKTSAGTADLWISGGAKPYVVKEVYDLHTTKGPAASQHYQIDFVSFNTPLTILAPTSGGST